MADRYDHGYILLGGFIQAHVVYKGFVDLEHIGREVIKIAQRRIAGTKIVDRNLHAKLL